MPRRVHLENNQMIDAYIQALKDQISHLKKEIKQVESIKFREELK